MKIGLLLSERMEELSGRFGSYSGFFSRLFSFCGWELSLQVYDVQNGVYPRTIDDCDGYLGTGSVRSVYEQEPWVVELANFVKLLHDREKKYVGVCFGHQMIAQALGGKCEPAKNGWGLGVREVEIINKKSWMEPFAKSCNLIFSHHDQITAIPQGGEVLGAASHCPCAIVGVGEHMLGIQAHPEFTSSYAQALLELRRGKIAAGIIDEAIDSFCYRTDERLLARWIGNFFGSGQQKG